MTFDRTKQSAIPVWLPVVAALLIVARIVSSRFPVRADVDLVTWVPIANAARAAQRLHRPILYEFSAAWCGPCQTLKREVFMDDKLARRINEHYVAVSVVDRHQEDGHNSPEVQRLMDRYAVNAFPTIVIASPSGAVLGRGVGYRGPEQFAVMLDHAR